MITLNRIYVFCLAVFLALIITFTIELKSSFAKTPQFQDIDQAQYQIITMNRIEAMTDDIQGKTQEAIGNITGDPKDQLIGKARQAKGRTLNQIEDIKDNMKLSGKAKAIAKNIEGRAQESKGFITRNRKDQRIGKGKQVESQVLNTVEDIKEQVKDSFK